MKFVKDILKVLCLGVTYPSPTLSMRLIIMRLNILTMYFLYDVDGSSMNLFLWV